MAEQTWSELTCKLTDAQLEERLRLLEQRIAKAHVKDLPHLNETFRALINEQVRRDMRHT